MTAFPLLVMGWEISECMEQFGSLDVAVLVTIVKN